MYQTTKMRLAAVAKLGSRCSRCNEADPRVLDIDHVKGDGGFHRRVTSSYEILKEIVQGQGLERFQLLCANCHRIKSLENEDRRHYLNSYTKLLHLCEGLNEKLQKKSWNKRVGEEKAKLTRAKTYEAWREQFYKETNEAFAKREAEETVTKGND